MCDTHSSTTYGLLMPGAGRMTNADPEDELMRAVGAGVETKETHEEMLVRGLFEFGHADNTIEVWGSMDDIHVLCGHCHQITNWRTNSGRFCCAWAGRMYSRYFEGNFRG